MASVTMTVKEYDEIHDELEFLRRIIREITTPSYDQWNLDYYAKNRPGDSFRVSSKLSDEVVRYLNNQAIKNFIAPVVTTDDEVTGDFVVSSYSVDNDYGILDMKFIADTTEDNNQEEVIEE